MSVSSALGPYLKALDVQARMQSISAVHIKLHDLYFLNSSCFQAFAAWVMAVAARSPETRYAMSCRPTRPRPLAKAKPGAPFDVSPRM